MKFRFAALPFALIALTVSASASESNKFEIITTDNGKNVGHASYSIDKGKTGYKVHSTFNLLMDSGGANDLQISPGVAESRGGGGSFIDLQYSLDYKTDADGSFLSGYAQCTATQTIIALAPSKNRDSLAIRQSRAGQDYGTETINVTKPDFLVLPNYDPAGIQVLLTAASTRPRDGNSYLVVIPANPDIGQNTNSAGFVVLKPEADASGTLNGKPVSLKHYSLTFRGGRTDIYADDAGTLMEAVIVPLRASYVRDKFVLTPAR
jgi:hypothetical protein